MTLSYEGLRSMVVRGIVPSILIWLCMVVVAHAHASLHTTEPRDGSVVAAPPASIRLYFSEPVAPTRLTITMPDGGSAALERFTANDHVVDIEPPEGMTDGTYLVSWRVVSEDGHPVSGTIVFSVGQPQTTQAGPRESVNWGVRFGLWLSRIGYYIGLSLGVGGVFAIHMFCRGSTATAPALSMILGIGMLGVLASVGFQGLDAVGLPASGFFGPDVWRAGMATSFGRTAAATVAALVLAGFALAGRRPRAAWTSVIAFLLAALAPSLSGHASTADPKWLMPAIVFTHIAALTAWTGALIPLAADLKIGRDGAAAGLRRFSRFIPLAVVALVASGGILAFVQVRTLEGLSSGYGMVLLIKLGLLALLFALAAVNRWKLTSGSLRGEPDTTRSLVRIIALETFLIVAVLGVAAAWRFTPPPRATVVDVVEPDAIHLHNEQAMAMLTVRKDAAGGTTLSASITTADFAPLEAQEVRFVLSNPSAGIEPITRQAAKNGEEGWTVGGLSLPLAGPWKIRVEILVDDFTLYTLEGEIVPTS